MPSGWNRDDKKENKGMDVDYHCVWVEVIILFLAIDLLSVELLTISNPWVVSNIRDPMSPWQT